MSVALREFQKVSNGSHDNCNLADFQVQYKTSTHNGRCPLDYILPVHLAWSLTKGERLNHNKGGTTPTRTVNNTNKYKPLCQSFTVLV